MSTPKTREEILNEVQDTHCDGVYNLVSFDPVFRQIALKAMEEYAQQFQTDGWTDADMKEAWQMGWNNSSIYHKCKYPLPNGTIPGLTDFRDWLTEYKKSKLPAPPGEGQNNKNI
jgi:hypothetical protein